MDESQRYVTHAIEVANEVNLDPVLLLAIMATESSFNPNAQSRAGAQGLMQVLTRVHTEKFEPYGGTVAAFVPEANIRVGALILKACIAKAGSLEAGLRSYLGAPNASSGPNSYTSKVIAEREELNDVARNRSLRAAGNSST
jgi:soluble lytic murein transglycosylase-like protein